MASNGGTRWVVALALTGLLPGLCGFDLLRGPNRDVEEGNRELADGKPDAALKAYARAQRAVGDDPALHYDLGAALLALKRYADAQAELQKCAQGAADDALEAAAFYELGNTLFEQKRYKDAAGAYIRTLRIDPQDRRAKWNLEMALRAEKDEEQRDKDRKKNQPKNSPTSQPSSQPSSQPGAKHQPSSRPSHPSDSQKPGGRQAPRQQQAAASQPASAPTRAQASPAPPPSELSKQKVDRLLDSIDHSYKAFATQQARVPGEPQPEKDW